MNRLVARSVAVRRVSYSGKRMILAALILGTIATTTAAQTAARPDKGVRANGSYAVSDIENINMANGNMNISIPLASLPPIAGGRLSGTISANYNSKTFDMTRYENEDNSHIPPTRFITNHLQASSLISWLIAGRYSIDITESHTDVNWREPLGAARDCEESTDPDCGLMQAHGSWYRVTLTTPDGTTHELRPFDGSAEYPGTVREYLERFSWKTPEINGTMSYYSYDGSYLWASIESETVWDAYLPDGTRIKNRGARQWIIDTNNNQIKINSETIGSVTTTTFRDEQTGREIRYVFDASVNVPYGQGRVEYQTVGNGWAAVLINFRSTSVNGWAYFVEGDPACSDKAELITHDGLVDLTVIASIVLPQSEPGITRQFSFAYNSDTSVVTYYPWRQVCNSAEEHVDSMSRGLGSLSQITFPSGAIVKYFYLREVSEDEQLSAPLSPTDFPGDGLFRKEVVQDGVTDRWTYSRNEIGGAAMTGPDDSQVSETSYPHDPAYQYSLGGLDGKGGLTYRTAQKNSQGNDVVVVERKWRFNSLNGMATGATGSTNLTPFNPVVDIEFTTLMDPPGTPAKMSAKKFSYDLNGNVLSETDYDWFDPALATPYRTDGPLRPPTQIPPNLESKILRVVTNTYHNSPGTDQNSPNIYHKRVDGVNGAPPSPLILNAVKETTIGNNTTILAKTRLQYDGNNSDAGFNTIPLVGNVTKESRDKDGTWINTFHTYDPHGNRLTTTDPKGNSTTWVYDTAILQPVSVTVDPNNQIPSNELTTTTEYDPQTGLVTKVIDPNGNQTITSYGNLIMSASGAINDPFGRPGLITDPLGRKIKTFYHDDARQVETKADLKAVDDGLLNTKTSYDRLGRVVKVESSEDTSAYTLITDTVYEQAGKIVFTSNPHRSGAASTDGWTRAKKDDLGRVVEVATFDGATKPLSSATNWNGRVQTSYNAEQTTVTDQAAKQRKSVLDGLGRLVRVFEDPSVSNFQTDYTYDALGNLLQVDQGTQQRRTFTYDSLSRLKSAKNPEQVSGSTQIATTYVYDDASNLLTKSGPNSLTSVSFNYDGLNRLKTKTLTKDGAFTVWAYAYDTATILNAKGRLVSVVLQNSTDGYYYDGYDKMGRVTSSHQITTADGQARSYSMSYEYDPAGNMKRQVYPSNKAIVYEYDNAGRLAGLKKEGSAYYAGATPTLHGRTLHGRGSGKELLAVGL